MITAIIISAIAGATIGYTIAAVLMMGTRSEPKENIPKEEPTRLFTVGCLVKWRGVEWEIIRLSVGKYDNRTYARLENELGSVPYSVSIDELEAVEE